MNKWRELNLSNRMPWLGHLALIALVLTLFAGCGEGYEEKPARLNIISKSDESTKQQAFELVSELLRKEGFEYFGRADETIALLQQDPANRNDEIVARLNRERTFSNKLRHLSVVWTDFSNASPADVGRLPYRPTSEFFIEINIYEERPGGFSTEGQHFYRDFVSALKESPYGASVVVVNEPPPTNESEYRRITIVNDVTTIVWATIVCLLTLIFTGALSRFVLKRLRLPLVAKRSIFVLVNTWLVAPLPFQGGFIFVVLGPHLLAFPWTDLSYYGQFARFAAVSFPCALLVCTATSVFFLKHNEAAQNVAPE